MVEMINLTPHPIVLVREDGSKVIIPPSGMVARVKTERQQVGSLNGFPVFRNSFGEVEGLPNPESGKVFIVSFPVLQALKGRRDDVLAPDTSPQGAVRDEEGRIVGVKGFQTL